MKEKSHSLDKILGDFSLKAPEGHPPLRSRGPVTIWIPAEYKDRYDRLQALSQRQFGKKVRELILAAIELTEAKAS